jgi:hypothetical protein
MKSVRLIVAIGFVATLILFGGVEANSRILVVKFLFAIVVVIGGGLAMLALILLVRYFLRR